jgi:hypothetical protein
MKAVEGNVGYVGGDLMHCSNSRDVMHCSGESYSYSYSDSYSYVVRSK